MELAQELFVAENVKDLETVVYALRRDIPVVRLYCIVYLRDRNRFELLSSQELFKSNFQSKQGLIVGVAQGSWEVVDLFCYMVEQAAGEGRDLTNPKTWVEETVDESVV